MNDDRLARTWWSQAWLARAGELVDLHGPAGRRARRLVSRGEVAELEIASGRISGRVRGERGASRALRVQVPVWDEATWAVVSRTVAAKARYAAMLLLGQMPEELPTHLAEEGIELFPSGATLDDEEARLAPQRWIALHLAFAAAVDADPFLLFAVRGRDRRSLLAMVRAARAGADPVVVGEAPERDPFAGLPTGDVDAFTRVRGDLTDVRVHPHRAERADALLRSLGDPPGIEDPEPLALLVDRAADTAWRIAAGEGAGAADEEVLLAELRAQRMADAGTLASALGWDPEQTREVLDRLFSEGTVLRTGQGPGARYRA